MQRGTTRDDHSRSSPDDGRDLKHSHHEPSRQLRIARRKPVTALLGATAGLVPVGVFELGHYELTSWSPLDCPKAASVYAGLVFSALTVLGWSSDMFGSRVKAIGFTALLEGIMMAADARWLSAIALSYLVVINAVASGCRLAWCDTTTDVNWPANLAAAVNSTPKARNSARAGRARRRATHPAKTASEVVSGYGSK
jgi:hypothetical protein